MCPKVFHQAGSEDQNLLQALCLMCQSCGRLLIQHSMQNGMRCLYSGNLMRPLKYLPLPEYIQGCSACDYTPLMSFGYKMAQDVRKTRHTATENTLGCVYTGTERDTNNSEESKESKFCSIKALICPGAIIFK